MGCSRCGAKRHNSKDIMGQYKYLNNRQLKARLEVYKKTYCKECKKRSECDYEMYVKCKKNRQ